MNISQSNTFGIHANNTSVTSPNVHINNNEWKSVNVSNNVMKPVTRVQPTNNSV
jgi:hypothetical protein